MQILMGVPNSWQVELQIRLHSRLEQPGFLVHGWIWLPVPHSATPPWSIESICIRAAGSNCMLRKAMTTLIAPLPDINTHIGAIVGGADLVSVSKNLLDVIAVLSTLAEGPTMQKGMTVPREVRLFNHLSAKSWTLCAKCAPQLVY